MLRTIVEALAVETIERIAYAMRTVMDGYSALIELYEAMGRKDTVKVVRECQEELRVTLVRINKITRAAIQAERERSGGEEEKTGQA